MWHAQRLLRVGGKLYDTGEQIPDEEVESWKNLSTYVRHGWVTGTSSEKIAMAGTHDPVESVDPATEGARQTFPREWPPADKPPTTEPVANAASSPRDEGPEAPVEAVTTVGADGPVVEPNADPKKDSNITVRGKTQDAVDAGVVREDTKQLDHPKQGVEHKHDADPKYSVEHKVTVADPKHPPAAKSPTVDEVANLPKTTPPPSKK